MMPDQPNSNMGIASLIFLRLISGVEEKSLTHDAELVEALGELAIARRRGSQIPRADCRPGLVEGIARGLLVVQEGNLAFRNLHIQELSEGWAVVKHLQPEYVDRVGMYDRAIKHLAGIGVGVMPLLVELLDHPETSIAKGAHFALAGIGEAAVPGLRWAILFGNARVRTYALNSLSQMKQTVVLNDSVLSLAATVLSEDGHAMVKDAAIALLSGIKHPVAIEALRQALTGPLAVFTRSLVIRALESLDTPEARRALDDAKREAPVLETRTPSGGWQIETPHAEDAPVRVPRVFISYAREDVSTMEDYRRRLELSGFEVWADSQRLVAGENWAERLNFAINSSDFVVGFLSTATWDGYQRIEVEQALARRETREEAPFFLPVFLSRRDWISGSDRWPTGLKDAHVIVADGFASGWTQLYSSLSSATRLLGLAVPPRLRAERRTDLADRDVWRTVFEKDFFSLERNPKGRPLGREWDLVLNGTLAYDRATGLSWTRSPVFQCDLMQAFGVASALKSRSPLHASLPLRLPTLEEAMSIMTPEVDQYNYHRPRKMSKSGSHYMLTCDTMTAPPGLDGVSMMVWVADFLSTDVQPRPLDSSWPVWLVASE